MNILDISIVKSYINQSLSVFKEKVMHLIPTKTSQLANDNNYIVAEDDPTVPAWAKQPSKPTYTKNEIGLGNVDNTADIQKPVSTPQEASINAAYQQSTGYTDTKIAELINGAPSTLDTLGEIAKAMQDNENVVEALESAIGSKAAEAELDGHTSNDTIHITESDRTHWNNKLAYNGNASSTIVVFPQASELANISTGEKISVIMSKVSKAISTLISHIATKATAATLGHVKLSDIYTSTISEGDAANGMGASQKAVSDAYIALHNRLGGLEFAQDAEGNWGYKPAGADTVTPFKMSQGKISFDTIYLISGYQDGVVFTSNTDVMVKGLTKLTIGSTNYSATYIYNISAGTPSLIAKAQGSTVVDISKYDKIRFQATPVSETGSQISGSMITNVTIS